MNWRSPQILWQLYAGDAPSLIVNQVKNPKERCGAKRRNALLDFTLILMTTAICPDWETVREYGINRFTANL